MALVASLRKSSAPSGLSVVGRVAVGCMSPGTIILIILILLLIGALPTWPYSSGWGYYPSYGLGIVLIILLILVMMGRIRT
jgi:hypothetical protein